MKLIIAGSRYIDPVDACRVITEQFVKRCLFGVVTEIVHGGCRGVDAGAAIFASDSYPKRVFPADWKSHGKAAGPIRNAQMAEYGDRLLLIWDGTSRRSASMKREMEKRGKPVIEVIVSRDGRVQA